jgi:hypothetical protein
VPPCHRGQRAPVKAQGTWHATTDPAEVCWLGVHGLAPTASKLKWLETSLATSIPYVYHTKSQFDFRPTTSLLFSANQGRFEESVAASTWVAPSAQRRQFGFGNLHAPLAPDARAFGPSGALDEDLKVRSRRRLREITASCVYQGSDWASTGLLWALAGA